VLSEGDRVRVAVNDACDGGGEPRRAALANGAAPRRRSGATRVSE
jgi:hypothetical protein